MTGLKRYATYLVLLTSYLFSSCGVQQQLSRSAKETLLQQPAFKAAHVGISIYEPVTGKYWFNHQGDKYFVPASNTKIPTCYAAMKYLGDSLVSGRIIKKENLLAFRPAGDPTFLHPEFSFQPLYNVLQSNKNLLVIDTDNWAEERFGNGWSWNDYEEPYMAERSCFPAYGNVVSLQPAKETAANFYGCDIYKTLTTSPGYFIRSFPFVNQGIRSLYNAYPKHIADSVIGNDRIVYYTIGREIGQNNFTVNATLIPPRPHKIPFYTGSFTDIKNIIADTLHLSEKKIAHINIYDADRKKFDFSRSIKVHSQPTDSLLKPMMHRSDNFFAEQSLLMVSNELLGVMNDEKIIDTLLKTDFKDLPQKPRWADGSGLSRYNLFTPQDFVAILNKMKNEFGMERIKVIFPTGGEGTISSYYKQDAGFIYGKTGTLSGVVAFSGFLYTKKGKLLIFSTLINNHQGSATDIRRAIENFLQGVRSKY